MKPFVFSSIFWLDIDSIYYGESRLFILRLRIERFLVNLLLRRRLRRQHVVSLFSFIRFFVFVSADQRKDRVVSLKQSFLTAWFETINDITT